MTDESPDGSIVRLPGEGDVITLFSDRYTIKTTGADHDGAFAVVEATFAPGSSGTPLHVNTREDENYYILAGTFTFRIDERTVEAPAGSFVHIPRGVVHTHWNAGAEPVKVVGMPAPGGFEHFFADLGTLLRQQAAGPPDMSAMGVLYEKYGLQLIGPNPYSAR